MESCPREQGGAQQDFLLSAAGWNTPAPFKEVPSPDLDKALLDLRKRGRCNRRRSQRYLICTPSCGITPTTT
ncbi:MAG: hypothetical protein IPO36_01005 [Anaerolineales bacterium]|nr:hypothetical protein [Anaerolineales bacterium]